MDSDDAIIETALEEMYNPAKEHVADVVYCENYYCLESVEEDVKNIRPATVEIQNPPFVDKPTFETEDLTERAKKLLSGNYCMKAALRFVRRDLLVDNDIKFPSLVGSEDYVWSMEILFCAKRFLRILNRLFVKRVHDGGISFAKYDTPDKIQRWTDFTIRGLKETDNFLKKIPFFTEKPVYHYEILNRLVKSEFAQIFDSCSEKSAFDLYNIFQEKFGDSLSEHDVLIAGLCTQAINRQKELSEESKRRLAEKDAEINQLKSQLTSLPTQSLTTAARSNAPAISVIVPMYNVETYYDEEYRKNVAPMSWPTLAYVECLSAIRSSRVHSQQPN